MSVRESLDGALKEAMRARQSEAMDAIRAVKSALKLAEIEKKRTLAEEEIHALIQSEVKKRRDSIQSFKAGSREDLAAREQAQADVLMKFLPEQLTEEELSRLAEEAVAATGASGPKDMGKVMGWLAPRIKGRADGSLASALVKKKLGG